MLDLIVAKGAMPESPSIVFGRVTAARQAWYRLRQQRFVSVYVADEILTRLGLHVDMLDSISVIEGGNRPWRDVA